MINRWKSSSFIWIASEKFAKKENKEVHLGALLMLKIQSRIHLNHHRNLILTLLQLKCRSNRMNWLKLILWKILLRMRVNLRLKVQLKTHLYLLHNHSYVKYGLVLRTRVINGGRYSIIILKINNKWNNS